MQNGNNGNNGQQQFFFPPPRPQPFLGCNGPDMSPYSCFTNYGWVYRNITANFDGGLNYTVCDPSSNRCRRFTSYPDSFY